jgi:predicted DNA-binding WGR domain protein/WD40 repeat protein
MPRFEFEEGSSQKFWEVSVAGATLTTKWGKLGTAGQQKTEELGDTAAARREHDKLIASKLKKGYRAVEGGSAAPVAEAKTTAAAKSKPAAKTTLAVKAEPAVKTAASGTTPDPHASYTRAHRVALPKSPYALAVSADGQWVASACFDQKLRIFEAATMKEVKVLHLGTSFPHSAFFSADSQWVFAGAKSLQSFSVPDWKKGVALKGHAQETQRSVLAPNGEVWTVSGEHSTPADWSARKWDLTSGKQLLRIKFEASVFGLDVSANSQHVVCGDRNGNVSLVDAASGKVIWSTKTPKWAYVTLFSADGTEVFAGGDVGLEEDEVPELMVLDAKTGAPKRTLVIGGLARDIKRLPNRMLLVGCNDWVTGTRKSSLRVVDPSTGKVAWSSESLGKMISAVAASADGRTLYAHTSDENALSVFQG